MIFDILIIPMKTAQCLGERFGLVFLWSEENPQGWRLGVEKKWEFVTFHRLCFIGCFACFVDALIDTRRTVWIATVVYGRGLFQITVLV